MGIASIGETEKRKIWVISHWTGYNSNEVSSMFHFLVCFNKLFCAFCNTVCLFLKTSFYPYHHKCYKLLSILCCPHFQYLETVVKTSHVVTSLDRNQAISKHESSPSHKLDLLQGFLSTHLDPNTYHNYICSHIPRLSDSIHITTSPQ